MVVVVVMKEMEKKKKKRMSRRRTYGKLKLFFWRIGCFFIEALCNSIQYLLIHDDGDDGGDAQLMLMGCSISIRTG